MSVGGAEPQVGFVVSLNNWVRDLFTGGRAKKLEDQQRQARRARIEEHHRRHPDGPESTPD
jgi:hypothetical protein